MISNHLFIKSIWLLVYIRVICWTLSMLSSINPFTSQPSSSLVRLRTSRGSHWKVEVPPGLPVVIWKSDDQKSPDLKIGYPQFQWMELDININDIKPHCFPIIWWQSGDIPYFQTNSKWAKWALHLRYRQCLCSPKLGTHHVNKKFIASTIHEEIQYQIWLSFGGSLIRLGDGISSITFNNFFFHRKWWWVTHQKTK